MSSENKKRKAKNSFMHNGGEKTDTKLKRINYYKKRDRNRIKREQMEATQMVNKKDEWRRERRVGEAVKAGIKCFCGSEAYRDILEVIMNGETFPRVHRIFCPNCGLQMRSPAGVDDDFIVKNWREVSDLHQHRKEKQDRTDRADLISREAAIKAAFKGADNWDGGFNPKYLIELPAVDAAPVVHGKWVHLDPRVCATISGRCSRCGWDAHYYEDDVADMPYCPNCGARMDGGKKNDEAVSVMEG